MNTSRIDHLETRIDSRFDQLETRSDSRFNALYGIVLGNVAVTILIAVGIIVTVVLK